MEPEEVKIPGMPNILDEIVAAKKQELAAQKKNVSLGSLKDRIDSRTRPIGFSEALAGQGISLIAEVKKASPSRGLLCPDFDPVRLAGVYAANGAAAISVLTDARFMGELEHLDRIKSSGASQQAPVLRKDFIFDPYQVYEARSAGADALLLIVSVLATQQLQELLGLSRDLGLECLVEIHDEAELQVAVDAGAGVVGINNRDLRTFVTNLEATQRLAPLVPSGKVVVSESGIFNQDHLRQVAEVGVNAVLVGEAIVTALDVAEKVRELSGASVPSTGA